MKISAKAEYACVAVLELAAAYGDGQPVRIRTIAEAHGIPSRFLVQILLQLKGGGYVASTRGASGGYRLVKPPEEISVAEIVAVMEGPPEPPPEGGSPAQEALRELWHGVTAEQQRLLGEVSFADLAERVGRQVRDMYYI